MQTLDAICGVTATTGLMPTANGYALVEANPRKLEQGCTVVLSLYGRQQFAKLMGQSFITEDGEAIEGESLEDVIVIGRVTYFVNRAGEDDSPII
jgi:DNA polymerase V